MSDETEPTDRHMYCHHCDADGMLFRWRPSPEAGPHWRCSECGEPHPAAEPRVAEMERELDALIDARDRLAAELASLRSNLDDNHRRTLAERDQLAAEVVRLHNAVVERDLAEMAMKVCAETDADRIAVARQEARAQAIDDCIDAAEDVYMENGEQPGAITVVLRLRALANADAPPTPATPLPEGPPHETRLRGLLREALNALDLEGIAGDEPGSLAARIKAALR